MKERDRGKSNFRKETDKENQERILKSMTEEERDQYFDELRRKRREKRMKKQKQERRKKLAVLGATAVISVFVLAGSVRGIAGYFITKTTETKIQKEKKENKKAEAASKEASARTDLLAQAEHKAAQYDYDGAIQLLKGDSGYDKNTEFQEAVKKYEEIKATCKPWPLEQVTHVFIIR